MAEFYEIRFKGHFDPVWSEWFSGLELTQLDGDETLLSGYLPDQAALHGLLRRIRDLNLTLISVSCDPPIISRTGKENSMKKTINKYATLAYFILTFLITWGSIFLLVGSVGFPISKEEIEAAGPMVYVGMLIGPSLAGILMIGLVDGRAGYKALLSRLGKWRVGLRWYAIALLTVPLLVLAILYLLSLTDPEYLPAIASSDNRIGLLMTGIVMGLAVGFFEELGWTGFVLPRLRQRYSVLASGLIIGVLWGAWHYPPFSPSGSDAGALSPAVYLSVLLFSFLPAYRVLLIWIYDRTESLLLVILMHAPLSASQLILIPPTLSGAKLVTYDLIFGAALWVLAVAVLVASPKVLRAPKPVSETA